LRIADLGIRELVDSSNGQIVKSLKSFTRITAYGLLLTTGLFDLGF